MLNETIKNAAKGLTVGSKGIVAPRRPRPVNGRIPRARREITVAWLGPGFRAARWGSRGTCVWAAPRARRSRGADWVPAPAPAPAPAVPRTPGTEDENGPYVALRAPRPARAVCVRVSFRQGHTPGVCGARPGAKRTKLKRNPGSARWDRLSVCRRSCPGTFAGARVKDSGNLWGDILHCPIPRELFSHFRLTRRLEGILRKGHNRTRPEIFLKMT